MKLEARNPTSETNSNVQNSKSILFCKCVCKKLGFVSNFEFRISNFEDRGFTLIELVVYIGIFSILVGTLTTAFISILNTQLSGQTISSTDENGKYLMARLTYDIARADDIITPASPGLQSTSLQLKINNIDYTYNLDANGNFQITDTTDSLGPYILNDYDATVSALTFNRIGSNGGKNTIHVAFTVISRTVNKTDQSKTFSTTIGTR